MSLIDCCAGLSLGRLLTHRDQKLSEALKKQLSQKKNGNRSLPREMAGTSGKPKDYRQSKLKSPKRRKPRTADDKLANSRNNDSTTTGNESIQEQISELPDADSAVSVVSTVVSHQGQSSLASVPPEEDISEVLESVSTSRIKTELSPGGMLGHTPSSKLPTAYSQDTFESLDSTLTSGSRPTPPLGTSTPFKSPDRTPAGNRPPAGERPHSHAGVPEEDYSLSENRTESISGESRQPICYGSS